MKISLLQPEISRGDVENNLFKVQKLIDKSSGDLLVLPEYVLTGSLVLDPEADLEEWIGKTEEAKRKIKVDEGKKVIINSIIQEKGYYYNCCEFLPSGERQLKVYPDQLELSRGIKAGQTHSLFEFSGIKLKILICCDLKYYQEIDTTGADFILFIYHFTAKNYSRRINEIEGFFRSRGIPILASSLVSDQNSGQSSYMDGEKIVSLDNTEGILEVDIR